MLHVVIDWPPWILGSMTTIFHIMLAVSLAMHFEWIVAWVAQTLKFLLTYIEYARRCTTQHALPKARAALVGPSRSAGITMEYSQNI